jgi:hypothetical protein
MEVAQERVREKERERRGIKLSNGIESCAVVRERERERKGGSENTLAWHRRLRDRVSEREKEVRS